VDKLIYECKDWTEYHAQFKPKAKTVTRKKPIKDKEEKK